MAKVQICVKLIENKTKQHNTTYICIFIIFSPPFAYKTVHSEKTCTLMQRGGTINSYPFSAENSGTENKTDFSSSIR